MAHIHLQDGSFTLFWVFVWWALCLALIGVALILVRRKKPDPNKIAVAAFVTAAAFAVFQVQIPIAGGIHLNLTPLIGILAGPVLAPLVAFIINILSAAIGHGGWSLIGANAVVNISEVLVGYYTFSALKKIIKTPFYCAGIATFSGLFVGNVVMIAIILISGIQGVNQPQAQVLAGLSLVAAVNMGVAVIEAFVTGFIVSSITRIRPDLLNGSQP